MGKKKIDRLDKHDAVDDLTLSVRDAFLHVSDDMGGEEICRAHLEIDCTECDVPSASTGPGRPVDTGCYYCGVTFKPHCAWCAKENG